eukprot:GHVN01076659.1.p1 GENE.GHVN01076659.1~~GHVN01076659.1.p1  ORF type:complete len:389 (+),score=82.54 GHVN01076659.1:1131-2297(+)
MTSGMEILRRLSSRSSSSPSSTSPSSPPTRAFPKRSTHSPPALPLDSYQRQRREVAQQPQPPPTSPSTSTNSSTPKPAFTRQPTMEDCLPFTKMTPAQEWEEENTTMWQSPFTSASKADVAVALAGMRTGPGDVVADIGCGDGRALQLGLQLFHASGVVGVEVNPSLVDRSLTSISQVLNDLTYNPPVEIFHAMIPNSDRNGPAEMRTGDPSPHSSQDSLQCEDRMEDVLASSKRFCYTPSNPIFPPPHFSSTPPTSLSSDHSPAVLSNSGLSCLLEDRGVTVVFVYLLPNQLEVMKDAFNHLIENCGVRVASLRFSLPWLTPTYIIDRQLIEPADENVRESFPWAHNQASPPIFPRQYLTQKAKSISQGRTDYKIYIYAKGSEQRSE